MSQTTFRVGELVRFKAGGPKMFVSAVSGENVITCKWFDQNHTIQEAVFQPEMLVKDEAASAFPSAIDPD